MRNKVDLSLPPDALFLNPWTDEGLAFLEQPTKFWRSAPSALIEGFSASSYFQVNRQLNDLLRQTRKSRKFLEAIEYTAVPVLVENAVFRKDVITANGKIVMSGASGGRAINKYIWEHRGEKDLPDDALDSFLRSAREASGDRPLPVVSAKLEPDIPFAIECRNTFNFFHFITESLAQLTVLDGLDFQGEIFFHFPNSEEKQRDFAMAFVDALFPEYSGRVRFERSPKEYDRVLTAFEFSGAHYLLPGDVTDEMRRLLPAAANGNDVLQAVSGRSTISMNSFNNSLISLRKRALNAIEGRDWSHLPKRFWVGRDDRQSRSRRIAGEDLLFEHLQLFGFEYVVFENLDPLEQIALLANAEVMIAGHGAGFTNMLFAHPDAWVIEIGSLQTARQRWGDFWPLAHAAQCRYITIFADHDTKNPVLEPNFAEEGIAPIALSEQATALLLSFVVTVLGHAPELKSRSMLDRLAGILVQTGAVEEALGLLEAHEWLVRQDADLSILKADCHKALGESKSELLALDQAYKVDRTRWRMLIRIIWCANACERPQVIRWALSRLEADFPDRYDAFVTNHTWVRYVA